MKVLIAILFFLGGVGTYGSQSADFAITDVKLGPEGFVEIHIVNRRADAEEISKKLREKTFLTIFIQDIRRAEYKLKYMPPQLFQPPGKVVWTTNFRPGRPVHVRAEINLPPVIPEILTGDNRMTKVLQPNVR